MEYLELNRNQIGSQSNVARISKITIIIGITLTLFGIAHDQTAAPEIAHEFLIARLLVAGLGLLALAAMTCRWGLERISQVTFSWMLLPQTMIAYMLAMTGGAVSPYRQGFIFALIAATLFPIMTLTQSLGLAFATAVLYSVAVVAGTKSPATIWDILSQPSMHIMTVIFMCAVARYFLSKTFGQLVQYENELSNKLKEVQRQLQDLAQLKALAVHQDKMVSMGHLVSGILHSINHPVNYALMAVNSLLGSVSVQSRLDLKDSMMDIKKALTSINSITSSLRRFSAPKGTNLSHVATICEFAGLVDTAVQLMADDLKDVIVVKEVAPNTKIHCDQVAFLSALTAILTNAAEALQRANRMNSFIKINASVAEETVVVEIADNGSGISEDTLTHIFDPFFTTDPSGKKLGLGLSIAYGEVVRHGGTLTAISILDEGTTMRIELPLAA